MSTFRCCSNVSPFRFGAVSFFSAMFDALPHRSDLDFGPLSPCFCSPLCFMSANSSCHYDSIGIVIGALPMAMGFGQGGACPNRAASAEGDGSR